MKLFYLFLKLKKKINDLELRKFLSFDNDFSIWDISLINEKKCLTSQIVFELNQVYCD